MYRRLRPVNGGQTVLQLIERAHRQRRRDERDQKQISSGKDVLGEQGQAGRAVQEEHVVVRAGGLEHPGQLLDRSLGVLEGSVGGSGGHVCRQHIPAVDGGCPHCVPKVPVTGEQAEAAALDLLLDLKQVSCRTLRVGVPQQRPTALKRVQVRHRRVPGVA